MDRLLEEAEPFEQMYDFLLWVRKAAIWLRLRPLLKCPFCEGKGGSVSGYYEPEWDECSHCCGSWGDLEEYGCSSFVGRMPLWLWVRARVSQLAGLWYPARLRDLIRCKLGRHEWMNEDRMEPGLRVCCVCYADKHVQVGPMEFVYFPGGGMGWAPTGSGLRLVNTKELGVPRHCSNGAGGVA